MKNRCYKPHVMAAFLSALFSVFFCANGMAYTLWSMDDLQSGTGKFYGPGDDRMERSLFPLVVRNLMFLNSSDAITPYVNNQSDISPSCAEHGQVSSKQLVNGKLSNGLEININIAPCTMTISGRKAIIAVVNGGPHRGRQITTIQGDGNIVMTADIALDFGNKQVVLLPFYATTGMVIVPRGLTVNGQGKPHDRAGKYAAGTPLKGRVGDLNGDGWIDGTFVAVGVMPSDSPVRPGQPFVMMRNFETNIPVNGVLSGNIHALKINQKSSQAEK